MAAPEQAPEVVSDYQQILLVAMCDGARCSALRALHRPTDDATEFGELLRGAVRGRPDAVLVSLPCLGPCDRACVAAVGPGVALPDGVLSWTAPPLALWLAELPGRARDLADWIGTTAPSLETLPASLKSSAA